MTAGWQWSLANPPAPAHRRAGIKITKATYGVPGDPEHTRDVTQKLQVIADGGERQIPVAKWQKAMTRPTAWSKPSWWNTRVGGETLTSTATDKDVPAEGAGHT